MDSLVGKVISHYRILERIGAGGMGVVYKAEDTKLGRTVALKFLPPELTRDQKAKQRFVQEARAASAMEHSNICTIFEVDEMEDDQIFISMAYYEGKTLKGPDRRGTARAPRKPSISPRRSPTASPRPTPMGSCTGTSSPAISSSRTTGK